MSPLAFDVTGRTVLNMQGADRVRFLNSFCTNDVKVLQPGQGCEAFITNTQGKTLGHVFVGCREKEFMLNTTPGQAAVLKGHLEKFVITEDVVIRDATDSLTQFLIGGEGVAP